MTSRPALAAEPNAEARRWYAEGKAAYAQGQYEEAVRLFERSYALSDSPALLFNMAQAHRLAGPGHCRRAAALYQSYLSAEPAAENKVEVEERLRELGDCSHDTAATQPAPSTVAPAPAPATEPAPATVPAPALAPTSAPMRQRSKTPTGPVLVTGTGAALLAAGAVLYFRAWDKHREAERICPCYPGTYTNWELLTNVSYALLAVGGATAVGGVTWWALAQPRDGGQPASAMLGVEGNF